MKFRIFLIIIFIISLFNLYSTGKKIGISRLYSNYKQIDIDFHLKTEDIFISSISTIPLESKYALNLYKNVAGFKGFFSGWKKIKDSTEDILNFNKKNSEIINEIKDIDTLITGEIVEFSRFEEKDFYDTNIIIYNIKVKIRLAIFDVTKKIMTDESEFEVELTSKKNFDDVKSNTLNNISKKISSYIADIDVLKEEIKPIKIGIMFIWLNKGQDVGLKSGNILVCRENDDYSTAEHTVVQIVRVYADKSLANILYTKGSLTEEAIFTRLSKINLELELSGGFTLSGLGKENISYNPQAGLRILIPIGIVYFNPVFQIDFNFFYKNSKLLFPFTFETGFQGKFNIHRFEFAAGVLVGVLFSPDENNTLKVDSASIRPYLHINGIINTSFNIFAECGYKYFINDNFSKDWKTDLSGLYFSFGFGLTL